ncbi:MAG: TolC family protein [Planctomycetota bacterium]|nr:TolC family protein [Planctomycetota bacterium]MDA1026515.1 TolC family protein [Planctomycetota bacterium]
MHVSSRRRRTKVIGMIFASLLLAGCGDTGIFKTKTPYWKPVPQHVDAIAPMDLAARSIVPPQKPDEAMEELLANRLPIEPTETKRSVNIAEVRQAVLEGNLDLRTELVSPEIARANLGAEEAKFEATIFAGYTRNDQGVVTNLEQGEPTSSNEFLAGLRLPLASGGTLTVDTLATQSDLASSFLNAEPWESNVRFSISQPLLRGAGVVNTASIRIAKWNRDLADARLKLAAIRILADADKAYWRLYEAWRELDVRKSQYQLAATQLERAQRRLAAGDAPEIDVIRARSGIGRTLESIIRADATLRQRQRALKRIMNLADLPIDLATALEPGTEPDPIRIELDGHALAAEAVKNRMEMLELEIQLSIDATTVDIRRNEALPVFAFEYRYSIQGDDTTFDSAYNSLGDSDSHRIGINGEVPIGNEQRENRLSAAILQRVQRLATKEARTQSIQAEVYDALDRLKQSWQSILAARLETMLAARTLQGEERQFDVGLRTSTDVLDALSRLADAQSREVQSLAAYQIALVDIAFATGTLLGQSKVEFEESDGAISVKEDAGTSSTVELKPADDSDSPDDTQPNAE